MASYETVRLINTILTLYYLEEMTQTEIAQRLGFSTAKVNRLLLQAREQGYVTITIKTPFQQLFELEDRLKAVFGLQDAVVIPALAETSSLSLNALGNIAAEFLLEHLRDGDVLGVGGGTAVNAVMDALAPSRTRLLMMSTIWQLISQNDWERKLTNSTRLPLWKPANSVKPYDRWARSKRFSILPGAPILHSSAWAPRMRKYHVSYNLRLSLLRK
jgi:hypothetical protein